MKFCLNAKTSDVDARGQTFMEILDRVGLLCMIVHGGSDCKVRGRTVLQKIGYFCRYLDWDVGRYRLHYYGPFSFELTSTIQTAESAGLVRQGDDAPHTFELTEEGRRVMRQFAENVCDRAKAANTRSLVQYLSDWTKRDLELAATLDYVHVNTAGINEKDLIEKVHIIKTAFSKHDIKSAHKKWAHLRDKINDIKRGNGKNHTLIMPAKA